MLTNTCVCGYCILVFSSPLSLTGTIAVDDVDVMNNALVVLYACMGYGLDVEEWTNDD